MQIGVVSKSSPAPCGHRLASPENHAMAAGIGSNEALAREQLQQLKSQWASSQEEFLQSLNPGGGPNRLGENLLGLYAAGYAPDALTDSAIVDLAESQRADGMFPSNDGSAGGQRPPITEGLIGSTARAVRLLRVYSIPGRKAEFEARLARAKVWLEHVQASCADDYAMRLLGLAWSGSDARVMRESASALLKLQRADGGWSANPHLTSDSYSTGKALYALAESGSAPVTDAAYRRGVEYLLTTQYPDGSWYVRSRAIKFQPYFQSGFPFGHDQWISAAGTAWAVTALARALEAK